MSNDNASGFLPTAPEPTGDIAADLKDSGGLPPSLQILLKDGLYNRVKQLAGVMAHARGFTPAHLVDKPEACFAVINMSLDWRLSPHFVARHTYQTPGGSIGYDGALVQSILEKSGRFVGAPEFLYRGDWQKITGKFEKATSQKGNEFVRRTWTDKDAVGLGIIVRWRVRGEDTARAWPGKNEPFWLTQCFPLNSPLWATDPKTQIAYLAIRRFANLTSPGILGAASFDYDDIIDASERARDVTPPPRPKRKEFVAAAASPEPEAEAEFWLVDRYGAECGFLTAPGAAAALCDQMHSAALAGGEAAVEGIFETNAMLVSAFRERGYDASAEDVHRVKAKILAELQAVERRRVNDEDRAAGRTPRFQDVAPPQERDDPAPAPEAEATASAAQAATAADDRRVPRHSEEAPEAARPFPVEPAERDGVATSTEQSPIRSDIGDPDDFWTRERLTLSLPTNKTGQAVAWDLAEEAFLRRIAEAASVARLDELAADNKRALGQMAAYAKPRAERVIAAFDRRREELR